MPTFAFALLVAACLWACTCSIPYLSECYTFFEVARHQENVGAALSPALSPFRPLQHLFFWLLEHGNIDNPGIARIPGFLMHAGSIVALHDLASQMGLKDRYRRGATLAFAVFPAVQSMVWVGAISTPARTLLTLTAMVAAVRHGRNRSALSGASMFAACFVALAWHEMSITAAILVAGCCVLGRSQVAGTGPTSWTRALTSLWLLSTLALTAGYVLYVIVGRTDDAHPLASPAAIMANGARASTALLPQWVRLEIIEALRGDGAMFWVGVFGVVLSAAGLLGLGIAGGRLGVFLIAGAALDMVLPCVAAGFVLRYAYLASALVCIAFGLAMQRLVGTTRMLCMALALGTGICWCMDTTRQVIEHREAGRIVTNVVAQGVEVRRLWPRDEILLVDVPAMWGREQDIVVFNWGLPQALARSGASGPWRLVRRTKSWIFTDHQVVDGATIDRTIAERRVPILVFDPNTLGVTWYVPGNRK